MNEFKNMIRRVEAQAGEKHLGLRRQFNRIQMTGGADTNRHTVYYDPNNGKTSQKILYVGLMKKERGQWVPHGKGTMQYDNGYSLTGTFIFGSREGEFHVVTDEEEVDACFRDDKFVDDDEDCNTFKTSRKSMTKSSLGTIVYLPIPSKKNLRTMIENLLREIGDTLYEDVFEYCTVMFWELLPHDCFLTVGDVKSVLDGAEIPVVVPGGGGFPDKVSTLTKADFMFEDVQRGEDLGYFQYDDYNDNSGIVGSGSGSDEWLVANMDLLTFLQQFKHRMENPIIINKRKHWVLEERSTTKKGKNSKECRNLCENGTDSEKKKYCKRKGPPYPANAKGCRSKKMRGNDNNMYVSRPNKKGVYTWKKYFKIY